MTCNDVLGCGDTQVLLTDRCGRALGDLTDSLTKVTYRRLLDDTTETLLEFALGGGGSSTCCGFIGGSRTWLHGIQILRDGEPVWFGPLTNRLLRRETAVLTARDVSTWLDERIIHNDYEFVDEKLSVVLKTLMEDALGPNDPCDILGRSIYNDDLDDVTVTKSITAGDGQAGDVLRDLSRNYLDYTALGTGILFGRQLSFGPYITLTDDDFLVDIEVEERGLEAATKWWVSGSSSGGVGDEDTVLGSCGGVDPYYGLLEKVASEDSVETTAEANASACDRLQASNPAPVYVNIPDGSRLSPTAPVCMEKLIPGTLINVEIRSICQPMIYQGRLSALQVDSTADGSEAVGITLAPLGTNVGQAGGVVSRPTLQ